MGCRWRGKGWYRHVSFLKRNWKIPRKNKTRTTVRRFSKLVLKVNGGGRRRASGGERKQNRVYRVDSTRGFRVVYQLLRTPWWGTGRGRQGVTLAAFFLSICIYRGGPRCCVYRKRVELHARACRSQLFATFPFESESRTIFIIIITFFRACVRQRAVISVRSPAHRCNIILR